jgi:branched-chain amino acid transport system substrate-binding protein
MPKLEEYGVPMVVETSSASTVTKRGNPWVFRISPPSEMEALGLEKYMKDLGIKKADFLAVNTDWGRGAVTAFGDVVKRSGAGVGATEFMDQAATDTNAQIIKIKADNGDTLFPHASVEQITLVLKQAGAAARPEGDHDGGAVAEPADQRGRRGRGDLSHPLLPALVPGGDADAKLAASVDEWTSGATPSSGLTEGFRGHDGILNGRRGDQDRRPGRSEGHP